MDENVGESYEGLEFENKALRNKNLEYERSMAAASYDDADEKNLIQYQLETDKIMERIEHYLKGHQVAFSEQGSFYVEPTKDILTRVYQDPSTDVKYCILETVQRDPEKKTEQPIELVVKIIRPIKTTGEEGEEIDDEEEIDIFPQDSKIILKRLKGIEKKDLGYKYVQIVDEDKKPLNQYGVSELMRIISMYVTKETFLSCYTEERINEILADLGDELNNFFYCNYEKMGMDTKFKESKYSLIIINVLHTIESCYRRALEGAEQDHLRTRSLVTQSGGNLGSGPQAIPRPRWNPLRPSTW